MEAKHPALEPQFTPRELGELWKMIPTTIIRIFREEQGVIKYSSQNGKSKREYVTLRIPESVARRVFERLSR